MVIFATAKEPRNDSLALLPTMLLDSSLPLTNAKGLFLPSGGLRTGEAN
ncbi:hypothetical protein [Pseudoalteromonas holothuriae]|nr:MULTISPECIES: hypothetical protein [unclassified Pseudoalteromonas]